jgi:DNA-binding FrmR family transcriptional regulator
MLAGRGVDGHAADGIDRLRRAAIMMSMSVRGVIPAAASGSHGPAICARGIGHQFSASIATHTMQGYIGRMRKDIKTSCQKRLNRIEGQVRGLSKMVAEDRYCIDIVTQISAVRAALRRVEEEVLRDHVSHCVEHAISSGNKADQREKISELMAVIGRSDR